VRVIPVDCVAAPIASAVLVRAIKKAAAQQRAVWRGLKDSGVAYGARRWTMTAPP